MRRELKLKGGKFQGPYPCNLAYITNDTHTNPDFQVSIPQQLPHHTDGQRLGEGYHGNIAILMLCTSRINNMPTVITDNLNCVLQY